MLCNVPHENVVVCSHYSWKFTNFYCDFLTIPYEMRTNVHQSPCITSTLCRKWIPCCSLTFSHSFVIRTKFSSINRLLNRAFKCKQYTYCHVKHTQARSNCLFRIGSWSSSSNKQQIKINGHWHFWSFFFHNRRTQHLYINIFYSLLVNDKVHVNSCTTEIFSK